VPTPPPTAAWSCPTTPSPTSRTRWARISGRKPALTADDFRRAAAADGLELEERTFEWLCEQGHVGLERIAKARRDPAIVAPVKAALEALGRIYSRLGGDVSVLHAARENLLLAPVLADGPALIAVDGPEHFTSHRLAALELYPADAPLGFDRDEHMALCRELAPRTDGTDRGLAAKGFGFGGVPRERAYHDALRDLAIPAMGHPPLVRVTAVEGDGAAAYAAWGRGRRSPRR
jgi:hypothetical protein